MGVSYSKPKPKSCQETENTEMFPTPQEGGKAQKHEDRSENLEQNEPAVNVVDVQEIGGNDEGRQDEMEGVFDYIPNFWGLVGKF